MTNPILHVKSAGRGVTPPAAGAKFSIGDVVKIRRLNDLKHLPEIAAVAVVVPAGYPPEYAWADATGQERPLMITRPSRSVCYIVAFDKDPVPVLLRQSDLRPTDHKPVEIRWAE